MTDVVGKLMSGMRKIAMGAVPVVIAVWILVTIQGLINNTIVDTIVAKVTDAITQVAGFLVIGAILIIAYAFYKSRSE